jgi:hypothetical protein
MSLGQGQPLRTYYGLLGRFAMAFTASSFAVFGLAGAIGLTVAQVVPSAAREAAACGVLSAALLLDAYSLRRKTWCPVTLRRQTPKDILHRYGARRAATAWGLDAGLVFTTYRVSSISWAVLALALFGVAPWWAGLGYAAGFLVPLLLGCSLGPVVPGNDGTIALAHMLAGRSSLARTTCVAALTIAVAVVGASLA